MSGRDAGRVADVIIVGGGLMGTATAFFLRRHGRSVIVLERDLVGQAASGASFGNIRRQGRFLPQMPLANRSREIWGRLPELLGEDAEFTATGHLRVCFRPEEIGRMEDYARDARPYGLDLELISRNAIRDRFPFLSPDALMVSHSPLDGHANPRLAAPAFARAARRAGAAVIENVEVLSIGKSSEDFRVETRETGTFRAPIVQISTGAWGARMSAAFGEHVPLTVRGPQMGVTEPVPYRIPQVMGIHTSVQEEGVYLRQVKRGNIVFGGGERTIASLETKRAVLDPRNTLRQLPHLRTLLPAMGPLRVIRTWSGVEGYVADDLPVIGPSAKVAGLYHAFGFCGHGFQLGPGIGATMAELISTGETSVPIAPFHVARFVNSPILPATGRLHLE